MSSRRIIGVISVVIGIVLVLVSMNINKQVEEGRGRVSSAQKKVDQGKQLFELAPRTKPVGEIITDSAQRKIDQGRLDIAKYENMSKWFLFGGIFLIIFGAVLFFTGRANRAL